MEITINLKVLQNTSLSVDQYLILYLLYYKKFDEIKTLYGIPQAIKIRNSLVGSKYLLSDNTIPFTKTILSDKNVKQLLGIKGEEINFWEFYVCYPIKVGTRVLRASSSDSVQAKKHKDKYLLKIKTKAQHEKVIKSVENFVAKKKAVGELQYLPGIEVVINNALWESWESLLEPEGSEGVSWNDDVI